MTTLETRRATLQDAQTMARLAMELGYDCDETSMRRRLLAIRSEADHAIFVAGLESGKVVGWIHIEIRRGLLGDHYAQIGGLVVAGKHRKIGVGRALMDRATDWAYKLELDRIRVPIQSHREGAHAFYERLGYTRVKEQRVYEFVRGQGNQPEPVITLVDR